MRFAQKKKSQNRNKLEYSDCSCQSTLKQSSPMSLQESSLSENSKNHTLNPKVKSHGQHLQRAHVPETGLERSTLPFLQTEKQDSRIWEPH